MGLTQSKVRTGFIVSTILSAIGLAIVIAARLANLSMLIAAGLFLAQLLFLWIIQPQSRFGKSLINWLQKPTFTQVGYLFSLSILGSSLGFLSWIFLFEPGSLVRDVLVQLSPVIGWGIGVTLYLLAILGAVLNEGEKKDGLLICAVVFSCIQYWNNLIVKLNDSNNIF